MLRTNSVCHIWRNCKPPVCLEIHISHGVVYVQNKTIKYAVIVSGVKNQQQHFSY